MQGQMCKDLKVVELAGVLAGPAVGQFFAELGASVIKVENKTTGGDVTRRWKAPSEPADAAASAYYYSVNWGKETQFLDLNDPADRRQALSWIAHADVVVSNYREASAHRLGMDYAALSALNPKLIYAEITGYGSNDPRPAFDVVLQAETGFLHMTGLPDGPPVKMPVALIDLLAAHQLKEGVLLALWQREKTGLGGYVRVSLYDAAIASLANQAANWLIAGHAPGRMGAQHPNIAPYGDLFTARDGGQLVLAIGAEAQFAALCEVLGLDLHRQEAFASNSSRVRHRAELVEALAPAIARWDRQALLQELAARQAPAGAVLGLPEVFEDPAAQRLLLWQPSEDGRQVACVKTAVFDYSATRPTPGGVDRSPNQDS
jgi:crotonobetainyl-CoA:carnitine CoA-transferase CaiB-like acyl-CoA transferase